MWHQYTYYEFLFAPRKTWKKQIEYRMDIKSEYVLYRKSVQGRAIYTMEVFFAWNDIR